jgi:hypothetical protein
MQPHVTSWNETAKGVLEKGLVDVEKAGTITVFGT